MIGEASLLIHLGMRRVFLGKFSNSRCEFSTTDYQLEMANLSVIRSSSQANSIISSTPTSAFFSVANGYRLFTASSKNQPDPDKEDVVWNEPEEYSAAISRKGHDLSSLPSIRDVLSRKASVDGQSSSTSVSASRISKNPSVLSANAGDSVPGQARAIIDEAVDQPEAPGPEEKSRNEYDQITPTPSRPASIKSGVTSSTVSRVVDPHIEVGQPSSVKSNEVGDRLAVVQEHSPSEVPSTQPSTPLPPLPPKDSPLIEESKRPASHSKKTSPLPLPPTPPPSSSAFATTLATGLNNAMKYVLIGSEAPSRFMSQPPSTTKSRSLLLSDIHAIDERPHIKYDWTMGKRTRFTCTVYYAKQFDLLRKRSGVHGTFVTSLSRSTNWAAEGGKSKSNFWKTSDDRFIIKTLVNAWNVADL